MVRSWNKVIGILDDTFMQNGKLVSATHRGPRGPLKLIQWKPSRICMAVMRWRGIWRSFGPSYIQLCRNSIGIELLQKLWAGYEGQICSHGNYTHIFENFESYLRTMGHVVFSYIRDLPIAQFSECQPCSTPTYFSNLNLILIFSDYSPPSLVLILLFNPFISVSH